MTASTFEWSGLRLSLMKLVKSHKFNGGCRKDALLPVQCQIVNRNVVMVNNHTSDSCKNGGHDFLEEAGGRTLAESYVGILKDPHVSHKGIEVAAVRM